LNRIARLTFLICFAVVALVAPASATPKKSLGTTLGVLWESVLETPAAENPFGTGGPASTCWDLGGGVVAPFGPGATSCTVKTGTKLFVAAVSNECSTWEQPNLTTEAGFRNCAAAGDAPVAPPVTLDGKPVALIETFTPLLDVRLPAGNLFDAAAGSRGISVGHGYVALLHPLTPGTHTIVGGGASPFRTVITVQPGR
jgi:hypothetical protein